MRTRRRPGPTEPDAAPALRRAPAPARRLVAGAAVAVVSLAGLAACGSGHPHPQASPVARPAPSSSSASSSSSVTFEPARTVVRRRHRRHRARPVPVPVVAPLTGLPATAAVAAEPAVVVKIDNVEAALPQTGPDQADVVYEEMVEGGLTRLAAVFQSQYPTTVGPVRSGRLTDEGIADDLGHPVLAYAGANALFQPILAAQPVQDVDDDTNPGLFVRNYAQTAPHNLYTDVTGLAATDTPHGPPPRLWAFRPPAAAFVGAGVTPASSLSIGFPAAGAQWTWDAAARVWWRDQNGAPDRDAHGVQLSASNVIVQFVPYITSAIVTGEGAGADGAPIPEGLFSGSGVAWYLSGGAVVKGTWTRTSPTAPTVYTDGAGVPIRLAPGRTWVELPQVGTSPSLAP